MDARSARDPATSARMPIIRWRRGELVREEVDVAGVGQLLKVRFASVCPSEEQLAPDWGVGLGHELVVEAGGVLAVLAPFVVCGDCLACTAGLFSRCIEVECPSLSWGGHGGLGGVVGLANETFLIPMPATTRPFLYALAEPAAAGVAASASVASDRVAVIGLGAVGIGAALAACTRRVQVTAFVRHEWQEGLAIRTGLGTARLESARPLSFPAVIVASGSVEALRIAQTIVEPGGQILLVGMDLGNPDWRKETGGSYDFFRREVTVTYHYMYTLAQLREAVSLIDAFEETLECVVSGPVSSRKLNATALSRRQGRRLIVDTGGNSV